MLATGNTEQTCRPSLSPVRFLGISAEEHQTFCAAFDVQIKVIDAEFYGMEGVQCMECLLRLCEAVPVRIWMRHSTPHPPPIQVQLQSGVPVQLWHLSFGPIQGDKPRPRLPSLRVHTRMYVCKHLHTDTHTHTGKGLMVRCPRLSEPSPPSNLSPVALRGLNTRPAGNTTPPSL